MTTVLATFRCSPLQYLLPAPLGRPSVPAGSKPASPCPSGTSSKLGSTRDRFWGRCCPSPDVAPVLCPQACGGAVPCAGIRPPGSCRGGPGIKTRHLLLKMWLLTLGSNGCKGNEAGPRVFVPLVGVQPGVYTSLLISSSLLWSLGQPGFPRPFLRLDLLILRLHPFPI